MDWDQQYELQGENPWFWLRQAHRLKLAADLTGSAHNAALCSLKENPDAFFEEEQKTGKFTVELDSFPVYVFLCGLAMENLAKGILIGRNAKHFTSGVGLNHKLTSYITQCGFTVSDKQSKLLTELETAVVWQGRYPTPRKRKDWQLREGPYGSNNMPGRISSDDKHEIEAIYSGLEKLLIEQIRARTP